MVTRNDSSDFSGLLDFLDLVVFIKIFNSQILSILFLLNLGNPVKITYLSFFFLSTASPGCNRWLYYDILRNIEHGETSMEALYRSYRYPDEPDESESLYMMDAPIDTGSHFGQMMWGWLIAPMDGEFTFFR